MRVSRHLSLDTYRDRKLIEINGYMTVSFRSMREFDLCPFQKKHLIKICVKRNFFSFTASEGHESVFDNFVVSKVFNFRMQT